MTQKDPNPPAHRLFTSRSGRTLDFSVLGFGIEQHGTCVTRRLEAVACGRLGHIAVIQASATARTRWPVSRVLPTLPVRQHVAVAERLLVEGANWSSLCGRSR